MLTLATSVLTDDQAVPAFIGLGVLIFFQAATFVLIALRGGHG